MAERKGLCLAAAALNASPMLDDEFFAEMRRRIEHLPAEEQYEQMLALIAAALLQMDTDTVLKCRTSVLSSENARELVGQSVLALIDGHLALRSLGS